MNNLIEISLKLDLFKDVVENNSGTIINLEQAYLNIDEEIIELIIPINESNFEYGYFAKGIHQVCWNELGKKHLGLGILKEDEGIQYDFSNSKLRGVGLVSPHKQLGYTVAYFKLDSILLYRNTGTRSLNSGLLYLENDSFFVVEEFYSYLTELDSRFTYSKNYNNDEYFQIENVTFRPEIEFETRDKTSWTESKILKIPRVVFNYPSGMNLSEASKYTRYFITITSFYFQKDVKYRRCVYRLEDQTIFEKRARFLVNTKNQGSLSQFDYDKSFKDFLQENWQSGLIKNYEVLNQAITLSNQALQVDDYSEFLIRYKYH